jgi:pSer/pThr/pTyr-binding forkhead associated (FHA) protein
MNALQPALARLEARLQGLVEGSLARLFPTDDLRRDLAQRLYEALRQETRQAPDGALLAPDQFTLFLPAAQAEVAARNLEWSQSLAQALAHELDQAASSAGLRFRRPPFVRLLPDPETHARMVSVLAQFSLDESTGRTLTAQKGTAPLPVLPAHAPDVHNAFLLLENGRIFPLEETVTNLGRTAGNHLVLPDERVSELHAQIRQSQGRYTIFDLGAENGTFVNQRRVRQYELQPGDVISLGGLPLVFGQEAGPANERTQKLEDSL